MIRNNAEKNIRQIFVLVLFLVMIFLGISVVKADSAQLDSNGHPFVLGKGGSRMLLKSHNNVKVIVVGKLGSNYIAMLNQNDSRVPELNGKLFLVDNINAGGTCTWDGNKSSIINIDGMNLDNMRYYHSIWGHSYMQLFWFDMKVHSGDDNDLWAVSSSCESSTCFVFKYEEKYDETAKCVAERKLIHKTRWTFGNCVKGIDVLDLNSATVGAKGTDKRCPPIFIEVSRPYGTSNGKNGDFWNVASEIWFKNIKMNNGVPELYHIPGKYMTSYLALSGYDKKGVRPAKNKSTNWGGICGGGMTALGTHKDTDKPTWAYYTMSSQAKIHWSFQGFPHPYHSSFDYAWNIYCTKHTFEYDNIGGSDHRGFINVDSRSHLGSAAKGSSGSIEPMLKGLFDSCSSILFDCKGPKVAINEMKEMFAQGKEMNGSKIGGYIGDKFGDNNNQFIGQLVTKKSERKEFIDVNYAKDEKNQALKKCDEEGRQVLAVFLGYPYTALCKGETPNPVKISMNFKNVKTDGVETGKGSSAEWLVGIGCTSKVSPFEVHAGYKGYINQIITKEQGAEFSSTVGDNITFDKDNIWTDRHKGIIFFDCKMPSLSVGGLVWKNGEFASVPGWVNHKKVNYHVIPVAGGVFSNRSHVYSNYFNLYDPAQAWNKKEVIYSPMTDGLECKSSELSETGNLFEFEDEAELENIVNEVKENNYEILCELKALANKEVSLENDTFKDKAVKWLTPNTSPDSDFGYDWKRSRNWAMNFSKFSNRVDEINEGNGGYWKFNIGLGESEGNIMTQNTSRTYTNTITENGYGFETSQVNNLTRNYQVKYYGFMVNPRVYKEVQINEKGKAERPGFIPEYCWDRNQSFALFVPAVYGSFTFEQSQNNYI